MTMNRQRTHTLTHFGPLFVTALGGWMAFNLANSGMLYVLPGMIVAALLAYAGTLVALRMHAVREIRPTSPAVRTTGRFTPRPAFNDMDIAAGD
jgi:hypothetical protein